MGDFFNANFKRCLIALEFKPLIRRFLKLARTRDLSHLFFQYNNEKSCYDEVKGTVTHYFPEKSIVKKWYPKQHKFSRLCFPIQQKKCLWNGNLFLPPFNQFSAEKEMREKHTGNLYLFHKKERGMNNNTSNKKCLNIFNKWFFMGKFSSFILLLTRKTNSIHYWWLVVTVASNYA